ncbi:MAG: hypothetical protein HY763_14475 [Planctomycetes bacterium]|nr:hypothetical protein [Planctomycetota bacterium]
MMDPFERDPGGRRADSIGRVPRGNGVELKRGAVVFVGEGRDDCDVIRRLSADWEQPPLTLTRDDRGQLKDLNWNDQFRTLVENAFGHGVSAIGLMFDADEGRSKATRTLKRMFEKAELVFPSRPCRVRLQKRDRKVIKTAYLINPHGRQSGSLETLFRIQIDHARIDRAPIGPCIKELMRCYERVGDGGMHANRDKIAVRTYLAYHKPSNTGLTVALRDAVLTCDGPEFNAIRQFVDLLRPPSTPLLNGG